MSIYVLTLQYKIEVEQIFRDPGFLPIIPKSLVNPRTPIIHPSNLN